MFENTLDTKYIYGLSSPTHDHPPTEPTLTEEMSTLNPDLYKSLPIPPLPRTQALNSKTFRPPPIDGSLTVPEIYDWHLENSPEHPLFMYSNDDGTSTTIKWSEGVKAIHRAGRLIQRLTGCQSPAKVPILAILANTGILNRPSHLAESDRRISRHDHLFYDAGGSAAGRLRTIPDVPAQLSRSTGSPPHQDWCSLSTCGARASHARAS